MTTTPKWILYTLLTGLLFFAVGLIIDDIYSVVTGLSLGIMATVAETGEKIIQRMNHPPKGL